MGHPTFGAAKTGGGAGGATVTPCDDPPEDVLLPGGTPDPGVSLEYSRCDHVHVLEGFTAPPLEGLVQWMKGDAGMTVAATRLSAWADQSAMGQNFLQVAAGENPYVLGDDIDGIPLVTFGVAGDANKHLATPGDFVDRFSVPMDGSSARTVMAVIKPRYDAAYGRTGGTIWGQSSWDAMFELRSDFVTDGAYAWERSDGDYASALQFTPVTGGALGPYAGIPTLVEHASPGFPALNFLVNNVGTPLAPPVMYGSPSGAAAARLSILSIAFLGGIAELLVWDHLLTAEEHAQAIGYINGRYPSIVTPFSPGGVTAVTATAPVVSSGGATPDISLDPTLTTGAHLLVDVISASIDFKTATVPVVVPVAAGKRFLPIAAYVELTNVNTLTVGPSVKLGNNGGHDNVAPVLAVANTVVTDDVVPFVLAAAPVAIDLSATGIIAEVTVNATATTATGRVHVIGVYI